MNCQINIVVMVNVMGALSDKTLRGNLWMMDNSTGQSVGQGTPDLCTVVQPGQLVQWVVHAVDVQTPVDIKKITFLSSTQGANGADNGAKLPLNVWSGVVPPYMAFGVEYRYRIELQMYEGDNSIQYVDTCSLKYA